MNTQPLTYWQVSVVITCILRVITAFIFLKYVIPLQIEEMHVKNGLKKLRYQLLLSGVTLFIINIVGLALTVLRYLSSVMLFSTFSNTLAIINAVGFLIVAYIQYQIYNQQYTDEHKKSHEIIGKLERGEVTVIPTEKGGD